MENSKQKSIENEGKKFLENTALKVHVFLERNGLGKLIHASIEYGMDEGNYTGNITYEFSITNCRNIEYIIHKITEQYFMTFSEMLPLDVCDIDHYIPDGKETDCYLFIFEKSL